MIIFQRLLKTTWQRIRRNPFHSIAAIFVILLAFFVMSVFAFVSLGSHILLQYFENKPQITAFLKDEATDRQVEEIKNVLVSSGFVSEIKYTSKEDALRVYKEQNKEEPLLLEFVTSDILPASLQVSATDIKNLPTLAEMLSGERLVENVIYQKDIVDTLLKITNSIRNLGLGVISFLLITSILITFVVVSLNISLHKDEIEIMKLVGADSWYIRTPFILEGVAYGTISSLIATLGAWGLLRYLSPVLNYYGVPPIPNSIYLYLLGGLFGVGLILGTVSALVATWKYLKV